MLTFLLDLLNFRRSAMHIFSCQSDIVMLVVPTCWFYVACNILLTVYDNLIVLEMSCAQALAFVLWMGIKRPRVCSPKHACLTNMVCVRGPNIQQRRKGGCNHFWLYLTFHFLSSITAFGRVAFHNLVADGYHTTDGRFSFSALIRDLPGGCSHSASSFPDWGAGNMVCGPFWHDDQAVWFRRSSTGQCSSHQRSGSQADAWFGRLKYFNCLQVPKLGGKQENLYALNLLVVGFSVAHDSSLQPSKYLQQVRMHSCFGRPQSWWQRFNTMLARSVIFVRFADVCTPFPRYRWDSHTHMLAGSVDS